MEEEVKIVNFIIPKIIVKEYMIPHHNIHKYAWTSNREMLKEIDHVLIDG
jgi:hypothetical protein